ncbi:MAG: peptide-methionine (S)-S-oxide reductase MsrA [Nitrosomonadales bacterium]|jgi:methionine-S-sulfoxide reductase|nr:peptide-methionine (S)-S-oxide reductase MsrA [Nitrosomonadales bacterium]MBT4183439.1 peptide-methionine (S)-S-oxide reductase MsrA [Nitrosomonadales bacterium]MBT4571277.1 peptide-methionine (S)-S-oxide reductase MsrA [Nitrosomonadales bacterium]MBT6014708.1 peptide-methionine (S)-S-oxide reductase MsrA [Nitrosomonadales bacterium]MBT6250855.1 peptide-methionine (S)-S-oxide reductase MsrA [Nitrosomonadales bacterium]
MVNKKLNLETTYLAGGCYWGLENLIGQISGVKETVVGFSGGFISDVTYKDVSIGNTGHAETIMIKFDKNHLSFESLLFEFFKLHNPTTPNQQGNDIGTQYRSSIFYTSNSQKTIAKAVIKKVGESNHWKAKIVTEIIAFNKFFPAEEAHQKYLKKNPDGYTCHFKRNFIFL